MNVVSNNGQGWVARELVDLTADQRKAYDERLAEERAEQAKKNAAEAARRKRQEAERRKREADENSRAAKIRADQAAKDAEVRAACGRVYQNTADKKIGDLTVREEQQVGACQALGLYLPR